MALLPAAGSVQELERTRAEVKRDPATQLYRVSGSADGWLVLRLEGDYLGDRELVIVQGAGRGIRAVLPVIQRYARALRATIRTHINSAALERIYQAQGFHRAEVVLRWRPDDGQ